MWAAPRCWFDAPGCEICKAMGRLVGPQTGKCALAAGGISIMGHRAFKRDGTPHPVRSVVDLTKSGVNASVPEWKSRMPGVDDAIALLGRFPHALLGTTEAVQPLSARLPASAG